MKKYAPILVVIVLILVAFGYFIIKNKAINSPSYNNSVNTSSPSPLNNQITGWNTYESDDKSFSMKYPQGMEVISTDMYEGGGKGNILASSPEAYDKWKSTSPNLSTDDILIFPLELTIAFPDSKSHSQDEVLEKLANTLGSSKLVNPDTQVPWVNENGATSTGEKYSMSSNFTKTSVGGRNALRVVNDYSVCYLVINGDGYLRICAQPQNSNLINDFDEMMSTLKFSQ